MSLKLDAATFEDTSLGVRGTRTEDRMVFSLLFDNLVAQSQADDKDVAPTTLIGTRIVNNVANRTRPLCPYPQVAKYKGTGNIDDAGSFACANP